MWISRKRADEDLRERFQEDYPAVKRYLKIDSYMRVMAPLFIMLTVLPYTRQLFIWLVDLISLRVYFAIWAVIFIPIIIFSVSRSKKYKIHEKLKGSLYRKRDITMFFLIFLPMILLLFFLGIQQQPIWLVAKEFGRNVQVATTIPFHVEDQYGDMDFRKDTLLLFYDGKTQERSGTTKDGGWYYSDDGDSIVVEISPHLTEHPQGKTVTLQDGTPAIFDQSNDAAEPLTYYWNLAWKRNGVWYSLSLSSPDNKFTEQDVVKIANSFQPFK